jgi:hypothetical protein
VSDEYVTEITELPGDPIGGASGEKRRFHAEFLGKTNNQEFPFTVANEVVAASIGMALGLNVPTVLTHRVGGEDCVLVQVVGRDPRMQQPPPATAKALQEYVEAHQFEVHGAIVFDLYMANNDRAFGPLRRNLMLDGSGRLLLYDNGNACFYRHRPAESIVAGIPRLDAVEADLRAMFDMDAKGNHYREFLTDWGLVREWCERIGKLPEFLIEAAVDRIPSTAAQDVERQRLVEFLINRRGRLYDQIKGCVESFPGLSQEEDNT